MCGKVCTVAASEICAQRVYVYGRYFRLFSNIFFYIKTNLYSYIEEAHALPYRLCSLPTILYIYICEYTLQCASIVKIYFFGDATCMLVTLLRLLHRNDI